MFVGVIRFLMVCALSGVTTKPATSQPSFDNLTAEQLRGIAIRLQSQVNTLQARLDSALKVNTSLFKQLHSKGKLPQTAAVVGDVFVGMTVEQADIAMGRSHETSFTSSTEEVINWDDPGNPVATPGGMGWRVGTNVSATVRNNKIVNVLHEKQPSPHRMSR